MDQDRWQRVQEIFHEALAASDSARADVVVHACGGDAELEREIHSLLAAHARTGMIGTLGGVADLRVERESDDIGPYRLLHLLGEGGMGVVYEAEQTEPVKRRVALKMMKFGIGTKEVIARFEAERQALAVMDHPNIARVFDAGATETGRPYFVMEYVSGVPVTAYCDQARLTTAERLELFVPICRAVQHAHQKGVIHRDLKPSNILIAEQDGTPMPKIIDFGIAKAIGTKLTEETLVTAFGSALGTPAYMSPEQAVGSGIDVDTRTDVYSLGVTLYELLAGELPTNPEKQGLHAFVAQLAKRETDPPTPSAKVSGAGNAAHVAALRNTDPAGLRRTLKRDLDWIVLKAMDKDRNRRYETVGDLSADIGRYLHDEPVLARPPSTAYRLGKFVKRHAAAVVLMSLTFAALMAFGVTVTIQSGRIAEERDKAVEVSAFLEDLLAAPDPFASSRMDTLRMRDFVLEATEKVRTELDGEPAVRAQMLTVLSRVNRNMGELSLSRDLIEEAMGLWRGLHGDESREVLGSQQMLAFTLYDMGNLETAESLFRETIDRRREKTPDAHSALADLLSGLGNVLQRSGRFAEAEPAYREAVERYDLALDPEHSKIAQSMNNLATIQIQRAAYDEAEPLLRRAIEITRAAVGDDHPTLSTNLNNLAFLLEATGELDEAETLHREALAIARDRFGLESGPVGRSLNNLGVVLTGKEEYEEAESLLVRAVAVRGAVFGGRNSSVGRSLTNLARVQQRTGRLDEGEQSLLRALDILVESSGPTHPRVATAKAGLGSVRHDQGYHEAAVAQLEAALDIRRDRLVLGHPQIAEVLSDLARCLTDLTRYEQAEPLLLEALESLGGTSQTPSVRRAVVERLVTLYSAWGREDRAEEYRRLLTP